MRLALILLCLYFEYLADGSNICKTSRCISVADEISRLMNPLVDPCIDFNRFSCGGFERSQTLVGPNDIKQTLDITIRNLKQRIKNLLEIKKNRKNDFETDQKIRDFYDACLNYQSILDREKLETNWTTYTANLLSKYIMLTLKKIGLDGWPFTEQSKFDKPFRWFDVAAELIKEGLAHTDGILEIPIINVEVGVDDFDDQKMYVLKLDVPDFDMDHKNKGTKLCTKSVSGADCNIDLETILGILNPDEPTLNRLMLKRCHDIDFSLHQSTTFAKQLDLKYKDTLKCKDYRDYARSDYAKSLGYIESTPSILDPLTCGTTDQNCPSIAWVDYLQLLSNASGNPQIRISNNQKIIVKDAYYLGNISRTLDNLNIKPFEMANYMGWKLVSNMFVFLKSLKIEFKQDCVNYLMKGQSDCKRSELGVLNGAVGSMYVREYFQPKWKTQVQEMVSYIKEAFRLIVPNSELISDMSGLDRIAKLNSLKEFIAYPDEMLNKSAIDGYYNDLSISNTDHPQNMKEISKFWSRKIFAKIGTKQMSDAWDLDFHQRVNTVNAYYDQLANEFVIPAAFLQEFNYAYDHPMYLNFAITGYTIGHEIMHMFDSIGTYNDALFSSESKQNWDRFTSCVRDIYSNIKIKSTSSNPLHINGSRTLNENIADIGGISLAYYAYQLWINKYGEERKLPGISYSPRQLFWIRSAQLHCAKIGENILRLLIKSSPHVPGGFRTNGRIMFSGEFAKDFNCPKRNTLDSNPSCRVKTLVRKLPQKEKLDSKKDPNQGKKESSSTSSAPYFTHPLVIAMSYYISTFDLITFEL